MKKVLVIILIIGLIGCLFYGCKNNEIEEIEQQISDAPTSQEPITTQTLASSPTPTTTPTYGYSRLFQYAG